MEIPLPKQPDLRPVYHVEDLQRLQTYQAVVNELDELLEQWPADMERVLALLAVSQAFNATGGSRQWDERVMFEPIHPERIQLLERFAKRQENPELATRHRQSSRQARHLLARRKAIKAAKERILTDAPSRNDTDHLLPVIAFLKAQGYEPATGDAFWYTRDGLGTYGFTQPLDVGLLQQHFDFPPSVQVSHGQVFDTRHFVRICQDHGPQPVRRLSFEK